ncbi:FliM/FliN family flagellar motor switch protein [Undibacterium sp.]|jgi:flagellar motor switch protein FliN/FliY|uniref:FliM/FliN family flagellar motor switch protein n=1 Tax=Undibacterium sp. TaxID=1914977 RepID=UPI002D18E94B|nr:FliM/FliN family flagellar motor switch protein [Undibacterium sp.]HTD03752.1 FliM/FliN family flagellar motor switch protein [Undibacterium sp.]
MTLSEKTSVETLLDDMAEDVVIHQFSGNTAAEAPQAPRRNIPEMMRKIPVTLTLEVGSARVSLQELMSIAPDSVLELDRLAGEPLVIKVNGTPIGRAEVVVAGENYGLKVIDLDGLNLDLMAP